MVPLAVFTVILALTSALPVEEDTSQVQISNRPALINVEELLAQHAAETAEVEAAPLPISIDFAVDEATSIPDTEDEEPALSEAPQEVAAVHLPIFINPGDVAASEPIQIANLPAVLPVAAEEETEETVQQVEVAHPLPITIDGIQPGISISNLPAFVVPGVDVAETEPAAVSVDVVHDQVVSSNADDSPCAACFAYMTKLIDELTNSVSVPQAVSFPNTREVPQAVEFPNTREVLPEAGEALVHEIIPDDVPVGPFLRPALLPNILRV